MPRCSMVWKLWIDELPRRHEIRSWVYGHVRNCHAWMGQRDVSLLADQISNEAGVE